MQRAGDRVSLGSGTPALARVGSVLLDKCTRGGSKRVATALAKQGFAIIRLKARLALEDLPRGADSRAIGGKGEGRWMWTLGDALPPPVMAVADEVASVVALAQGEHWEESLFGSRHSRPLMCSSMHVLHSEAGCTAQALHRDFKAREVAGLAEKDPGVPIPVVVLVPAQAGTHLVVVPGSHLMDDEQMAGIDSMPYKHVDVAVEPGQAILFVGSLYHGGGAYPKESNTRLHFLLESSSRLRRDEVAEPSTRGDKIFYAHS